MPRPAERSGEAGVDVGGVCAAVRRGRRRSGLARWGGPERSGEAGVRLGVADDGVELRLHLVRQRLGAVLGEDPLSRLAGDGVGVLGARRLPLLAYPPVHEARRAQVAHVLQLMLDSLGYRVVTHTSSREALQAFERAPQSFDLVITDMTMPEMTGDEFARAALTTRSDMPIILCTGFNEQMTEERARDIGIRQLIYKPLVRAKLAEVVKEALANRS